MFFRVLLTGLIWVASVVLVPAQSGTPLPDRKQAALNRYTDFTNECIHVLYDIRLRLETLNRDANRMAVDERVRLQFTPHAVISDFTYKGDMTAVCTPAPGSPTQVINLKRLYEATATDYALIPTTTRSALNRHRDEMMYVMIEVLGLCDSLAVYVARGHYLSEPNLQSLYIRLQRISLLYTDFQQLHDKLEYAMRPVARILPPALNDLAILMERSRDLVRSIRYSPEATTVHIARLRQAIHAAQVAAPLHKNSLEVMGLRYDTENTGYLHLIGYASQLADRAEEFLKSKGPPGLYADYPLTYYYYNERMISLYNHHKYGINAYYNQFIGFTRTVYPHKMDETPIFLVAERTQPAPPDVAQALPPAAEAPEDIMVQPAPKTLEGAATTHLIFLLDVSASMNKPERLPLLKASLAELLDLMRPEDRVSIIAYSGKVQVLVSNLGAQDKEDILSTIRTLQASGETQLRQGLQEAYKLARTHYIRGGNNRIVLASDGAFDISPGLKNTLTELNNSLIPVSILVVGRVIPAQTASSLSELARVGGGTYYHMTQANAHEILIREARGGTD
ncbi:MAG: VWA domain-containing protein [Bacteroidia bacterium]|nr:VWA domain-containing protein [Bacteroidia bacterium]